MTSLAPNALMRMDFFRYFIGMAVEAQKLDIKFRRMEFNLNAEIPRIWCMGDPVRTHFANAFSVLLPAYERLFISTLSGRLKELREPTLRVQGKAFCAQEGQHAAIHRNYNRWLTDLGYTAVPRIDSAIQKFFSTQERLLPKSWLLASTAGGEHLTSFVGNDYLSHPEKWTVKSDPTISGIWQWHAAEEIEHKAVCFDVYQALNGGLQLRRIAFLVILFQTLFLTFIIHLYFLWKDGLLFRKETWRGEYHYLLGQEGFLAGVFSEAKKYLKKRFHPWDTQDANLVSDWEKGITNG